MEKKIKSYPKKTFEHAVAAVDVVLFTVSENALKVLLLNLKEEPFNGSWALPGGLVAKGETLEAAVARHLKNKVGVTNVHMEQLYTFGDPKRDPAGWVVSVAYLALVQGDKISPVHSERYEGVEWHEVKKLPSLAYDHKLIIQTGVERLQGKLEYTNIIYSLMPKEFTLTDLQTKYEVIMDKKLDKRNFRKKILSLNIVKKLNKKSQTESTRPAELFSFTDRTLRKISII